MQNSKMTHLWDILLWFSFSFCRQSTTTTKVSKRMGEKSLLFGFDIYFPWKNKRQVQNFSWLSQNISTTGPESPRHISWHALLRTSFPPSSALLIEELHWQLLMAVLTTYHSFQWTWTMWQRKKRKWFYVVSLVMMHTKSQSICILKNRITCRNSYLNNMFYR